MLLDVGFTDPSYREDPLCKLVMTIFTLKPNQRLVGVRSASGIQEINEGLTEDDDDYMSAWA